MSGAPARRRPPLPDRIVEHPRLGREGDRSPAAAGFLAVGVECPYGPPVDPW